MPEQPVLHRRRLLGGLLAGAAAGEFTLLSRAEAQTSVVPPARADTQRMQPIRQIRAGELDVGYYETGPANGTPVLLLHGYPYDIHSFVEVAPLLAMKGYRVIVPHLRGHGTTRFLDAATFRSGQQSAVALDQIALLDALHIERAVIAGYDWGARTACIMAALWPQRCLGLLSVNGYIVNNLAANLRPLPAQAEHGWWYQYYFATDRGREGLRANRRDIARILWKTNSPRWNFSDASFERTASSFDNPDYVDIVVHNYRWRLSLVEGDPRFAEWERRLAAQPTIGIPTITMDGDSDGVVPATDGKAQAARFTGSRRHLVVNAGHNVPQEAPQAFTDAVSTLASQQT